jgi:hypothetical protein
MSYHIGVDCKDFGGIRTGSVKVFFWITGCMPRGRVFGLIRGSWDKCQVGMTFMDE